MCRSGKAGHNVAILVRIQTVRSHYTAKQEKCQDMKTEKKLYFEGLRQVPIMDNNEKRLFEKTIPLDDAPDGLDPLRG